MTENNTCLFSLPECPANEGSPVLITGGDLYRDDTTDSVKACLKLNNNSGKEVSSVRIRLCPLDKDGHKIEFETLYERSGPLSETGPHIIDDIMLPFMTCSFNADIIHADFADGSKWDDDKSVISDEAEKNTTDESAHTADRSEPEVNAQAEKTSDTADSVTASDDKAESKTAQPDIEETAAELKEAERTEPRVQPVKPEHGSILKKLIVILIPSVLILSGIAIIFIRAYLPERRYTKAVELFNSGHFSEAISAFEAMNGYKDSSAYISTGETMLAYQAAVASFQEGDYDTAYREFTELKDFGNSAEWAARSKTEIYAIAYGEADSMLRKGKLIDAANAFYQIREYSDSWDRCFEVWGRITRRKSISAGSHTVCLTKDGRILRAGNNDNGELNLSLWKNIADISAGNGFTAGLMPDGTVAATGNNEYGQCDVGDWEDIVSVYAGYWSTAGVKADGTVVIAGRECDVSGWSDIKAVSSSIFHTVGLRSDGTVVAAKTTDISGSTHDYGQMNISSWKNITAVATGVSFTVGLKKDGTVVAVGDNTYGQCDVEDWEDIVAISADGWHVIGLKADGTVVAAGWNENGECDVEEWEDIVAISTGTSHTLGLKSDGTLVAAGNNKDGRCDVEGWTKIRIS